MHEQAHHESSDIDVVSVFAFGAALIVVALAVHVAALGVFGYFNGRGATRGPVQYPLALGQAARLPPEPRLQSHPRQDLIDFRAREDARLNSYGWVDKSAGTVRIPIDEAMKLAVQRGLPTRTGNNDQR